MKKSHASLPQGRAQLVRVLAASGDVILVDNVVDALSLSRTSAAQRLARWTEQGWLRRVGRGAYVPATLDTLGSERVLDDAWVLVPALFAPAYVGGRTAAEHWDLTEQIFKDLFVVTARAVRTKRQERHGVTFTLKHAAEHKLFGTRTVWRHQTRVPVSDVHRTIVDMLDDPAIGGGLQHVDDCLGNYFARDDRDDAKLIDYATRLGNGAVFKRLGFLAERRSGTTALVQDCTRRLSGGYAKLDPAQAGTVAIGRWRLAVPQRWAKGSDQ